VDGSFGGEGGGEIHEEENVGGNEYRAGVKAGDEKGGRGGALTEAALELRTIANGLKCPGSPEKGRRAAEPITQ
jgi:hypothetical protein